MHNLQTWLNAGMRLRGKNNSLGFLFIYELLTNTISVRMLSDDHPFHLGYFLTRMLPEKDSNEASMLMSILRVISFNQSLASAFPKSADDRRIELLRL